MANVRLGAKAVGSIVKITTGPEVTPFASG